MRTTFPRRPAAVNGGELSHSVAPPSEANSPSPRNLAVARVISCTTLLSSDRATIETPIAAAISAAIRSWLAFIGSAYRLSGRCQEARASVHPHYAVVPEGER